jgi:hypothetical protein
MSTARAAQLLDSLPTTPTQAHPHQSDANSYVLLLDVGNSVLGTATSSRMYAAIFLFSKSPPRPDLMVLLYAHIQVPRMNLALEH